MKNQYIYIQQLLTKAKNNNRQAMHWKSPGMQAYLVWRPDSTQSSMAATMMFGLARPFTGSLHHFVFPRSLRRPIYVHTITYIQSAVFHIIFFTNSRDNLKTVLLHSYPVNNAYIMRFYFSPLLRIEARKRHIYTANCSSIADFIFVHIYIYE